uniref:Transmembrane protein n=1 Tax=Heterorhabditis bacteriophora TaxID=37862 RepID=A0A1I7XHI8_HETBA
MSCWEKLPAHGELIYQWKKVVIFGGLALAFYVPYKWFTSVKEIPVKHDWAEVIICVFFAGVVYLHQLPRTKNLPSVSVSSLKVETWLRMADIHYEIVPCPLTTRSRAVTLPFIKFNGQVYSGSAFIIRFGRSYITSWLISTEIGHSYEEQVCTGCDDLVAISKYLSAKHYFTGFKPTTIDATLFSVISQIILARLGRSYRKVYN